MFKKKKKDEVTNLDRAAGTLLGIGAINWGVVGLTNMDPVRAVFGKKAGRIVYALMGASAAYGVARSAKLAKK